MTQYRELGNIQSKTNPNIIRSVTPLIPVRGKLTEISNLKNKVLYWINLNDKLQVPSSVERWIEIATWGKIFHMVHYIVIEPYLQSFQYKITNRLTNCNLNLYTWKIKNSSKCDFCELTDTIEHHFFLCGFSKKFFEELRMWVNKVLNINDTKYTLCEMLFDYGVNEKKLSSINMIQNILFLIWKWYINISKTNGKPLVFNEYLLLLKSKSKIYLKLPDYSDNAEGVNDIKGYLKAIASNI